MFFYVDFNFGVTSIETKCIIVVNLLCVSVTDRLL